MFHFNGIGVSEIMKCKIEKLHESTRDINSEHREYLFKRQVMKSPIFMV